MKRIVLIIFISWNFNNNVFSQTKAVNDIYLLEKNKFQLALSKLPSRTNKDLKNLLFDSAFRFYIWEVGNNNGIYEYNEDYFEKNFLAGKECIEILKERNHFDHNDMFWEASLYEGHQEYSVAILFLNDLLKVDLSTDEDLFRQDIYYERGKCKFNLKDYYGAIQDLDEAVALKSSNSDYYFLKGKCYMALKKYDTSLNNFNQSINIKPDKSEQFFWRGINYVALKEKEKGCLDLSKAGELGFKKAYQAIEEYCNGK